MKYLNLMKSNLLKVLSFLVLTMFLFQCSNIRTVDVASEKAGILKADREFSDYSSKNGMKKALELFGDETMVMLRENSMPVVGKAAFNDLYKDFDDSRTTLVWEPLFADVSASGDLGYSYGIYTITVTSDSLKTEKGTYLSIWKKDREGKWKFVVDTGNEGIGE
jgi:ketosteroid isomerase-like protein